ncbi:SIS domain-containing protein [Streptomyces sp. NPDC002851]
MLDESLLDDPEALARADRHDLLRGAAESGARVRAAVRHAAEAGITELRPDGRPRSVLIAGPGTAAGCVADVLGALAGAACPVILLRPSGVAPAAGALRWTLPRWAGSVDLLLIATPDGTEAGLEVLADQAYRRGCTVVSVAPARAPLTASIGAKHGLSVSMATPPYAEYDETATMGTDALWALLTPLLLLLDRTGLITASREEVLLLADRLDATAERCGPAIATYSNPAKTLAAELAETLPLIWTEGTAASPTGRRLATLLAELSGLPALAAELPEALPAHGSLLTGTLAAAADPDDFFRDRVEVPEGAMHARVLLLRDGSVGEFTAAPAARELALGHDVPISELAPDEDSPQDELDVLAELIAVTDFAAVYLALASGGRR